MQSARLRQSFDNQKNGDSRLYMVTTNLGENKNASSAERIEEPAKTVDQIRLKSCRV